MSLLRALVPDGFKKWLAFGHGVGIEVVGPHGGESLRVTAVRVSWRRANRRHARCR